MGVDVSRLSPWAQKQIAQKIAAQIRDKAENQDAKQNKYHNTPADRQAADGKKIRKAIDKIFEEFEGYIFYDIATSLYVAFGYNDGKLITVQI